MAAAAAGTGIVWQFGQDLAGCPGQRLDRRRSGRLGASALLAGWFHSSGIFTGRRRHDRQSEKVHRCHFGCPAGRWLDLPLHGRGAAHLYHLGDSADHQGIGGLLRLLRRCANSRSHLPDYEKLLRSAFCRNDQAVRLDCIPLVRRFYCFAIPAGAI